MVHIEECLHQEKNNRETFNDIVTCDPPGSRAVGHLVVSTDGGEHLVQTLALQVGLVYTVQDNVHHLEVCYQPLIYIM